MTTVASITVDLRSDTVTRPTADMWTSMRSAPLGDDVLGDEPTVQALESRIATMLGKEGALFTPSGTMANQLAIRVACGAGDEIVTHRENHIIHYETGGPAALSGCMVHGLDGDGGIFDADALAASVRHMDIHHPRTRFVAVENSHNRGGGSVWRLDEFESVAEVAHRHDLHVHVDGARLFNAAAAAGYSPGEFVRTADSASVCFSKGLGAPVGSALVGSRDFIDRARRFRKMFGGGMRQSGILAAAALHALDHHAPKLRQDHAKAERLADGLDLVDGLAVEPARGGLRTNIVFFQVDPKLDTAASFARRMTERGVAVYDFDPTRVRAVTHLDVEDEGIEFAIRVAGDVAKESAS